MFKLKLAQKLLQKDRGFTIVEVLVAILIASLFVGVAMQAVVVAALFRAKAQEFTAATNWIQEDLEQVKYESDDLEFPQTTMTAAGSVGASSITISSTVAGGSTSDFSVNDTLKIGTDTTSYKITAVSGTTLTISPTLAKAQVANTEVFATKKCSATTKSTGLADALRDKIILPTSPSSSDESTTESFKTIKGKQFKMTRTATISSSSPYNVLQVKYNIAPSSGNELSVAKFYVEVIPNVSFQCP